MQITSTPREERVATGHFRETSERQHKDSTQCRRPVVTPLGWGGDRYLQSQYQHRRGRRDPDTRPSGETGLVGSGLRSSTVEGIEKVRRTRDPYLERKWNEVSDIFLCVRQGRRPGPPSDSTLLSSVRGPDVNDGPDRTRTTWE